MCELVELRTVTPDYVLEQPSFKGISFYFNPGSAEIVRKDALHKVGSVILKNGTPASVHRFIAQGMCFGTGGNGGSSSDRQYKFRPFAQYHVDGNDYNVWDDVQNDYLLGRDRNNYSRYVFVKDFDRQQELQKQ